MYQIMNTEYTMKSLPKEEQPYERCERLGASGLRDAELLAIIFRSGTKGLSALELSKQILYPTNQGNGILNIHHWTLEQLLKIKGVGKVKALQILCISELAKRLAKAEVQPGLCFQSPDTIASYYMEDMRHETQEHIKLLMLNGKGKLIGENNISKGTVNASLLSPRELFIEALQKEAVSIVILHNHPSGDPTPSKEDRMITKRIQTAGSLIGIELQDHIIIGNNCYFSFVNHELI